MNDGGESRNTITNYGDGLGSAPCGACKFLRRKCITNCVFAPHFSTEEGLAQFSSVHKIFGASNTTKLLNLVPENQRREAIYSILYEAQARIKDPVYGCVRVIVTLQREVTKLQAEISQLKSHQDLIIRSALPATRTISQQPDLTLHLYTPSLPKEGEDKYSSRHQPLHIRDQLVSDNRQLDKGKQVEGIGSSGKRVGHENTLWDNGDNILVPPLIKPRVGGPSGSSYVPPDNSSLHDIENAKSTLREILSMNFSVVVQRENDVISAVRTLLNSANLSLDQCIMLTNLKSELSRLVNQYQLAEAKFNYHHNKIKQRDNDVASIIMMKEAHEKSRMREFELVEENEKIKIEIEQLNNKMKKNQESIESLIGVSNEELLVINRLNASLDATAAEVEGWFQAKGTAEKTMMEASKKWETFKFHV